MDLGPTLKTETYFVSQSLLTFFCKVNNYLIYFMVFGLLVCLVDPDPGVQKRRDLNLQHCLRSVQFSDKSTKTLTDDFYLTVFSPLVHYTLEDIFVHLPTLCNLNEDEVIPREVLDTVSHSHLRSLRDDFVGKEHIFLRSINLYTVQNT